MLAYVAALFDEVSTAVRRGRFSPTGAPDGMLAYRAGFDPEARDVMVLVTGWGAEAAGAGARWLAEAVRPSAVVSVGYSGGTRAGLAAGSLVIGNAMAALGEGGAIDGAGGVVADGMLLDLAHGAARELRLSTSAGLIGTSARIAISAGSKKAIGEAGPVLAVDLESWHVARVASSAGIPIAAVRVIVDTVNDDLPSFIERLRPGPRPPSALPALRYIAGAPVRLGQVVRTGMAARRARGILARFLASFTGRWHAALDSPPPGPLP